MTRNLEGQETKSDYARGEAICENVPPSIRLEDLPQDVLYKIVSKLRPKEIARTRVLSSEWRCVLSTFPRLTFDGVAMYKCDRAHLQQHIGKFIHEVNAVLQKYRGMVVETLEMQLSFVSLKPPSHFKGFPNLRQLHIQSLHVSRKDLEDMLSHCSNLEWLRIDRCHLDAQLIVDGSLSHLLYLHVECCKLTKIKFHAANLVTFLYECMFISIDLSHSSKLENAYSFRLEI
ncbi:hypothetical protein EJB05_49916 [Eragrostis curvula]|uniref:F-box domain-containing protein n=1 Tax=Eragrostis curvula TaxID=38414 RepID=A0A5J9T5S2_9POAL|nr:hypothetical protein EJB05_49916 [Eragrostis curvula]